MTQIPSVFKKIQENGMGNIMISINPYKNVNSVIPFKS